MIRANELRLGNWLTFYNLIEPKKYFEVDGRFLFNLTKFDAINQYYQPIPLTPEILEKAGFEKLTHFTVQNSMNKSIGRNRVISIGGVGTPNEIVFLNEEEGHNVKSVIVLRNFDYDGKTYLHQLQNIHFSLTDKELEINLDK